MKYDDINCICNIIYICDDDDDDDDDDGDGHCYFTATPPNT